ncbi:hypothetical protein BJ684DRAFT_22010, partial [Piptocephalis cylindrospora]
REHGGGGNGGWGDAKYDSSAPVVGAWGKTEPPSKLTGASGWGSSEAPASNSSNWGESSWKESPTTEPSRQAEPSRIDVPIPDHSNWNGPSKTDTSFSEPSERDHGGASQTNDSSTNGSVQDGADTRNLRNVAKPEENGVGGDRSPQTMEQPKKTEWEGEGSTEAQKDAAAKENGWGSAVSKETEPAGWGENTEKGQSETPTTSGWS